MVRQNNDTLERHDVTPEENTVSMRDENIKDESADSFKSKEDLTESNQLNDKTLDSNQTKEKSLDPNESKEKNTIDSCQSNDTSFESNELKDTSTDSDQLTEKLTDSKQSNENSIDSHQPKENSIDSNQSEDKTNISLTRLERTYDSEEDSDTKEATINFIQSEIGSRVSGNGNNHFKIGKFYCIIFEQAILFSGSSILCQIHGVLFRIAAKHRFRTKLKKKYKNSGRSRDPLNGHLVIIFVHFSKTSECTCGIAFFHLF